jgi:quinol monooxygenase YgiN
MSVVIVATIYPKPDQRLEVTAGLEQVIAQVHADDIGCELFAPHENDGRLVMIEKWADRSALEGHASSAASRQLTAALAGKLTTDIDVVILNPRPAGTKTQGIL